MTVRWRIPSTHPWVFLTTMLPVLLAEVGVQFIRFQFGVDDYDSSHVILVMVLFSTGSYGVYRAAYFNPVFDENYRRNLSILPWNPAKTPIRGTLFLTWKDVGMLSLLSLFAAYKGFSLWGAIPLTAAIAYALVLSVGMLATQHFARACVFLGSALVASAATLYYVDHPLSISFVPGQPTLFGMALLTYLLAASCTRASLSDLSKVETSKIGRLFSSSRWESKPPVPILWPYSRISAKQSYTMNFGGKAAIILALTVFAYICEIAEFDSESDAFMAELLPFFYLVLCVFGILGRGLLYFAEFRAPISFPGRLATGRLIIPGYDKAWVAPLVATLVCTLGLFLLNQTALHPALPKTVCAFLTLAVLFFCGPNLRHWQLVGHHRYTRFNILRAK